MSAGSGRILLSEVIGGLSYALDLTEGEPPGHAVRTLPDRHAARAGARTGRGDPFGPLLRAAAQGRRLLGELGADGGAVRRRRPRGEAHVQARRLVARLAGVPLVRSDRRARRLAARPRVPAAAIKDEGRGHALADAGALRPRRGDRAARWACRSETAEAIRALDEHWDGRGQPRGLRGDGDPAAGPHPVPGADGRDLPRRRRPGRRVGGWPGGAAAAGSIPRWSRCSARCATTACSGRRCRRRRPGWEPADRLLTADDARLDRIADRLRRRDRREVALDLPALGSHERDRRRAWPPRSAPTEDTPRLRRAALLHDIGKLAISNRILDKPSGLTRPSSRRCASTRWSPRGS